MPTRPCHRPIRRRRDAAARASLVVAALTLAAGCEYRPGSRPSGDSARATAAGDTSAAGATAAALPGPAIPPGAGDSALAADSLARDTAQVRLAPERPRRGDVVFALVRPRGADRASPAAADAPRCRWAGRTIPCRTTADGVLVIAPVSADDSAGTYELVVEAAGGGRVAHPVTVEEREFGREVVFLRRELLARARSAGATRDARALRRVLAGEPTERRWRGAWGEPLASLRVSEGQGYGEERFYLPASDSGRVTEAPAGARARGAFAADTATPGGRDTPAWRHAGLDLAAPRGTEVRATAAGTVAAVGDYALAGRTVVVDHGDGVMTAYFHLDTALVRRGDAVEGGRAIGRVGATGLATGPHLHFGVYVHGRDVDPASWYRMPPWALDTARPATPRP